MSMIGFPLLLIPLAIVNIAVFLMGLELEGLQKPVGFSIPLLANNSWAITYSDALLTFALFMLLFEVVKSARPGAKYFTDHLLSLLVFAGAAAEFLLLPKFAHSTFFLLTLMALIDVIAGIAIRAVQAEGGCGARSAGTRCRRASGEQSCRRARLRPCRRSPQRRLPERRRSSRRGRASTWRPNSTTCRSRRIRKSCRPSRGASLQDNSSNEREAVRWQQRERSLRAFAPV